MSRKNRTERTRCIEDREGKGRKRGKEMEQEAPYKSRGSERRRKQQTRRTGKNEITTEWTMQKKRRRKRRRWWGRRVLYRVAQKYDETAGRGLERNERA